MNYLFLADGFEEVEALTTVDILRRAGMSVTTVSINDTPQVRGAHGIIVLADMPYTAVRGYNDADWLILPGGLPGATNLAGYAPLTDLLKSHAADGGNIAAICASPSVVLAPLGILTGKKATGYPGTEDALEGGKAKVKSDMVVADGNVITGKGPAAAMPFALAIVESTLGAEAAKQVADGLLYQ